MEKSPPAVFYEKELVGRFPEEFERAKSERLLRHVQTQVDGGSYAFGQSRSLTVVSDEGKIEAFDDEDPEFDPIELAPDDLIRWCLDLNELGLRFQQANQLSGIPGAIDDRLLYLGEAGHGGLQIGFVLGFLHERRSAMRHLKQLPNLHASSAHRTVVVCPTFMTTLGEQRELSSLHVFIVPLAHGDLFAIDHSLAEAKPFRKIQRVALPNAEAKEFESGGFRTDLAIHMTGHSEGLKGNVLQVGGQKVVLNDAPFKLFLRLVIQLHEVDDGFIGLEDLKYGEGIDGEAELAPDGIEQALSRLRKPFAGYLDGLPTSAFIERKRGRVRLSTHHKCVSWNRELLLQHPDRAIQKLAARLPKRLSGPSR